MNRSEELEIDRIVSEIADGGVSPERTARLNDLLRDRPNLQEHYSSAMTLHMLLNFEFDLTMQQLQPVVSRNEQRTSQTVSTAADQCVSLSRRIGRDFGAQRRRFWHGHFLTAVATAAAVAAVFVTYLAWQPAVAPPELGVANALTSGRSVEELNAHDSGVGPKDGLVVRDAQSLRLISRLTKTPSFNSLLLPRCPSDEAPGITLCSGTAWMEQSPTQRERGYVVGLAPGYQMDLFVYTDAAYQNGLSVVELDDHGQMTGSSLAFSNLEKGDLRSSKRRQGCIGNYSEFNDRSKPKYYLLTGSHRTLQQEADDDLWRLSDFNVQQNSSDIMVIGWDDSCYEESGSSLLPDKDFNDVRAMVRFSRGGASNATNAKVRYSPDVERDLPLAPAKTTGFPFEVKPGEVLVLLVSSSAKLQNSMRVVDAASRQIIWQDDGVDVDKNGFADVDRGVYTIRNYGSTVRQYEIQVQTNLSDNAAKRPQWQDCPYQETADGDRGMIIGFEDNIMVPENVDWNDIRVYARWLSD